MQQVSDYQIVYGAVEEVEKQVTSLIQDGWQPLGAPRSAGISQRGVFQCIQAMVKYGG